MIQQVKAKISPSFLTTSYELSQETIAALQSGDKEALKTSLTRASQLLRALDPVIYHPKLVTLVEVCQGLDAVAKSSGSGGGDCGIALAFDRQAKETLINRWQAADIDLLYQERWGNHDES